MNFSGSDRSDQILISGLELWCSIGVPEAERTEAQRILADIEIIPCIGFDALADDIHATIDYDGLCRELAALAASRPRHLIETLATDLARHVINNHPALAATVHIRKFILEQTEYVGVRCTRRRKEVEPISALSAN
jgi:7,8-dihydroneopterin aldolase/epimerase/oxygenase